MQALMYAVGTLAPTPKEPKRRLYDCIYFRRRTLTDTTFITIEHGPGYWAHVRKIIRGLCHINYNQLDWLL